MVYAPGAESPQHEQSDPALGEDNPNGLILQGLQQDQSTGVLSDVARFQQVSKASMGGRDSLFCSICLSRQLCSYGIDTRRITFDVDEKSYQFLCIS